MAPSQHIRPTLGTTRGSRKASGCTVLTLVLGATLALSACGAQAPGTAAVVNGTTIGDKDVQSASVELAALTPDLKPVPPGVVLRDLILEPFVLAEIKSTGKSAPTDAQVRKVMSKLVNPSASSTRVVRTDMAIQTLSPASKTSIVSKLGIAKITVNPRYGVFDPRAGDLVPGSPDWIKASAAPGAK